MLASENPDSPLYRNKRSLAKVERVLSEIEKPFNQRVKYEKPARRKRISKQ